MVSLTRSAGGGGSRVGGLEGGGGAEDAAFGEARADDLEPDWEAVGGPAAGDGGGGSPVRLNG